MAGPVARHVTLSGSSEAQGTRDTTTYRRFKAALDAIPAIDTHDHLLPFDRLLARPRNRSRQGCKPRRALAEQLLHVEPPARAVDARDEVRRLVAKGQTQLRQRSLGQLLIVTSFPPFRTCTASTSIALPTTRPANSPTGGSLRTTRTPALDLPRRHRAGQHRIDVQ